MLNSSVLACRVRAIIAPDAWTPFRYVFASRCDIIGETDAGHVEVEVTESSPEALAAQLAGFGGAVTLVDPPTAVAAEMTRISTELATTLAHLNVVT